MEDYDFKVIRKTWIIISKEIDQYGQDLRNGKSIVHGVYPDRMTAEPHLPEFADFNPFNRRWSPKNVSHSYWETSLTYRDEVLFEGSRAEVTMQLMGMIDENTNHRS
jgi:hypothetical protein